MPKSPIRRLLIVGAGLTAASIAARARQLRTNLEIVVVEARSHIGGNCFESETNSGTRIHRYGPHIFHSPSPRITSFLSEFTSWRPYQLTVTGEIEFDGALRHVPFPYSRLTEEVLGRPLSPSEITDAFFRGYSRKMWGTSWEDLPASVRSRVPANDQATPLRSDYFPGQFVALPAEGYNGMIQRMFGNVESHFNADPQSWTNFEADHVVYTGRPDLIPLHASRPTTTGFGSAAIPLLPFRSLTISFSSESEWPVSTALMNFCHERVPYTRRTCHRLLTGGGSGIVSTETPRDAMPNETDPFYPVVNDVNRQAYVALKKSIAREYPRLTLAGRLGTYRYFDMYQAVGHGISVADQLFD